MGGGDPSGAWDAEALSFFVAAQRADGGFSESADGPSDYVTTVWVGLALQARPGASWTETARVDVHGFLVARARPALIEAEPGLSRSNALSLTLLYAVASGLDARSFGSVDLVDELLAHQNASGAIGGFLNENLVGAGAVATALGLAAPAAVAACDWVESQIQQGGWDAFENGSWYVANALLTLVACGRPGPLVDGGAEYLLGFQRADGGFGHRRGNGGSDASTTASAVAALRAARPEGEVPPAWVAFVAGLQEADGAIAFSAELPTPRVKTTAEVLLAFSEAGLYGLPSAQSQYQSTASPSASA